MLRCRPEEEMPRLDEAAIIERLDCFQSAPEAVEALVSLEMRLAASDAASAPRFARPKPLDSAGH